MNIIKGIDRIAIVLAVIALVPGFFGGWHIYKSEKKVTVSNLIEDFPTPEEFLKRRAQKSTLDPLGILEMRHTYYPPNWQCGIAGIGGSIAAFLIVLISICGMSRGIRRLSLWIIDGFRNKKSFENHS